MNNIFRNTCKCNRTAMDDTCCTMQSVLEDNAYYLEMCQKYSFRYILIDEGYPACLEECL